MNCKPAQKTPYPEKSELPAYFSSTQAIMSYAETCEHLLSKHQGRQKELADLILAVEALKYEAARVITNSLIESNHVRVLTDFECASSHEKPHLIAVI